MAGNGVLDARDRAAMLGQAGGRAVRRAGHRGRHHGGGDCPGRGVPGPAGGPGGGARSGLGHLEPVEQAHPRRAAVPGAVRLQAGLRGPAGTRPARVQARPAPGQAGFLHVPAVQEGGRASLRRGGPGPVRRDGGHAAAGAASPAPDRPRRAEARPGAVAGPARGRHAVLRRAGRRRAAHADRGPHGGGAQRGDRDPGQRGRAAAGRGRDAGDRRPGARRGVRPRDRGDGGGRGGLRRGVDRPGARAGRGAGRLPGPDVQGRAHRGAAGGGGREHRDDPADRQKRAVLHPVGRALDRRHDRHRLLRRPGRADRDRGRHRSTSWPPRTGCWRIR